MDSADLQALTQALQAHTEALVENTAALRAHHQVAQQWGAVMAHPDANPALSPEQAAQYAGRHGKTIERAAKAGDLEYLQTGEGGRILYRLSSLNTWLDSLSCGRTPAPAPPTRRRARTAQRRAPKVRQYGI